MFCVDTLLGRKHLSCESLNLVILILRRSSGQGFHLKVLRLLRPIKLRSFDGKITVLWFFGINLFFLIEFETCLFVLLLMFF
jgi:hypothetical protein